MASLMEWRGVWYRAEYGAGCDDCFGTGAIYEHTDTCRSDFCAGNGDEHSCLGDWLPCPACGSLERYTRPTPARVTRQAGRSGGSRRRPS